jgi:CRISPR-associated protein Cmr4
MERKAYLLHALSPLHAGTGHAADVIDLPIARMKATGIPIVPGSSIKGVLRDARKKPSGSGDNRHDDKWLATFGPETQNAGDHAGALVVSDARLLALPVRSFKGTFAYVTCPLLLRLAKRDLGSEGKDMPTPSLKDQKAMVGLENVIDHGGKLYLQDLDLTLATGGEKEVKQWSDWLAPLVCGKDANDDILSKRFAIVDDDTMSFLWETATQLDQRVRLNEQTRTVDTGALWLEESLPVETILIGLMEADRSRRPEFSNWPAADVLKFAVPSEMTLQFGGKATTGHGRCRLLPVAA